MSRKLTLAKRNSLKRKLTDDNSKSSPSSSSSLKQLTIIEQFQRQVAKKGANLNSPSECELINATEEEITDYKATGIRSNECEELNCAPLIKNRLSLSKRIRLTSGVPAISSSVAANDLHGHLEIKIERGESNVVSLSAGDGNKNESLEVKNTPTKDLNTAIEVDLSPTFSPQNESYFSKSIFTPKSKKQRFVHRKVYTPTTPTTINKFKQLTLVSVSPTQPSSSSQTSVKVSDQSPLMVDNSSSKSFPTSKSFKRETAASRVERRKNMRRSKLLFDDHDSEDTNITIDDVTNASRTCDSILETFSTSSNIPQMETPIKSKSAGDISSNKSSSSSKNDSEMRCYFQRKNRFIEKIPACFADLKVNFNIELSPIASKSQVQVTNEIIGNHSKEKYQRNSEDSPYLAYYWNNFLEIIKSVLDIPNDEKLFNHEELETVKKFYKLSESAQMLYVRLFARHHEWIPSTKISYPEISKDLQPTFHELMDVEYLEGENSLSDLETTLNLLKHTEIKKLCKNVNVRCETSKTQCIKVLMETVCKYKPLFSNGIKGQTREDLILKKAKEMLLRCYRVMDKPRSIFRRIIMLYSLGDTMWDTQYENQPVQLTRVMQVNMGRMTFPKYKIDRRVDVFRTRDDLLKYENAFSLESDIWSLMDQKKFTEAKKLSDAAKELYTNLKEDITMLLHELSLPIFLRKFSTGHLLTRCLNYRIDILQKLKSYEEANLQLDELLNQTTYCQNYRGHWMDRYALNMHQHLKQPMKALETIEQGLNHSLVTDNYKISLSNRAERILSKKQKDQSLFEKIKLFRLEDAPIVEFKGQRMEQGLGTRSVFLYENFDNENNSLGVSICSVEQFALMKYSEQGYPKGVHGEGSVLTSLFGLLFWDIIYCEGIPDAFRSPHQPFPLDLSSEMFYSNRKVKINERYEFLETSSIEIINELVEKHWRENVGCTSLVNWDLFTCSDVMTLISCIDNICLRKICERLISNFGHYCSGVPDLVVWNPTTKLWKMVEVKGPGDKLSDKQRVWLNFLTKVGAPVEVCYVKASGGKTIQKAVRKNLD